jgi:hypothetical protein
MRSPPPAKRGEVNHALADRFTLVHASLGAGAGWLGWSLPWAFAFAVTWELVENPLKAYLPRIFPHATKDTLRNAVGDVLAFLGGWAIARYCFAS